MKYLLIYLCLISTATGQAQTSEQKNKDAILAVMDMQVKAWNNYDLEKFMTGYWKSDSLKFYGKGGLTKGYENTLKNYQKGYPSKDHTGILRFKINDISKINKGAYYVMGEYFLTRKVGDANGIFMVLFKKIKGEWKIIADTSCD